MYLDAIMYLSRSKNVEHITHPAQGYLSFLFLPSRIHTYKSAATYLHTRDMLARTLTAYPTSLCYQPRVCDRTLQHAAGQLARQSRPHQGAVP